MFKSVIKLTSVIDISALILASILVGWLLVPRPIAAHAQVTVPDQTYATPPRVDVLNSQQIDLARRIGNLESKQDLQADTISKLQSSLSSETSTTRTAGGVLMSVIVILLAFNALRKFK